MLARQTEHSITSDNNNNDTTRLVHPTPASLVLNLHIAMATHDRLESADNDDQTSELGPEEEEGKRE